MRRLLQAALVALCSLALLAPAVAAAAATEPGRSDPSAAVGGVVLWYFWRDACPHCERARLWLEALEQEHPQVVVKPVEVVQDAAGRALFTRMMSERGERVSGVPTFVLGDAVWVGFSRPLADEIDADVRARLGATERGPPRSRGAIALGPFGVVDLGAHSMVVATLLIAFVDGFNPCSLWVLTVLIAMILGTRSRARIAAVGLTFLLVTAAIYGLFIAGLFAALGVAAELGWIRTAVALLALLFGAVNVKDYFAYKKGLSFTIPDRFKPRIYRGGRAVRKDRSLPVTLAITVALAAGVALIELPCTAGFPVVWTALVSEAGVGRAGFAGLLAVYLLVYLGVEIAILAAAVVTLKASRLQEEHGRILKLFAGVVMVALAVVLLVDPTIMEQLVGSALVIAAAVAVSVLVLVGHRVLQARREQPSAPPPAAATGSDAPRA